MRRKLGGKKGGGKREGEPIGHELFMALTKLFQNQP